MANRVKFDRRRRHLLLCGAALAVLSMAGLDRPVQQAQAQPAPAAAAKPNILVILGDDIGTTNVSAYSDGLMGYETPNIDRIANEGIRFLHYYGEQSLHRRPRGVPHRPARHPHRPDQGRLPRRADGHEPARSRRSAAC